MDSRTAEIRTAQAVLDRVAPNGWDGGVRLDNWPDGATEPDRVVVLGVEDGVFHRGEEIEVLSAMATVLSGAPGLLAEVERLTAESADLERRLYGASGRPKTPEEEAERAAAMIVHVEKMVTGAIAAEVAAERARVLDWLLTTIGVELDEAQLANLAAFETGGRRV